MKKIVVKFIALSLLAFSLTVSARAAVETYKIDPVHSSVGFSIRHFVSKVPGSFTDVQGTLVVDREHWENSTAEATLQVSSVNTANEKRDAHLETPDFFDAAKYPTITFKSTSWKKTGENTFDVTGGLTIKETTKPVVLKVTLLGFGPGMRGAQLSGWEATTTLNKSDFGVAGPAMMGKALGDEVTVNITLEAALVK